MAAPVEMLRRVKLLADLEEVDLAALSSLCQERTFGKGSPVTTSGSRASGFFMIHRGEATLSIRGEVRKHLRPGDCFGELALIDGGRRMADITADTELHCYGLSQRAFHDFVSTRPALAWKLLENIVGMLRECQARNAAAAAQAPGGGALRRLARAPRGA